MVLPNEKSPLVDSILGLGMGCTEDTEKRTERRLSNSSACRGKNSFEICAHNLDHAVGGLF